MRNTCNLCQTYSPSSILLKMPGVKDKPKNPLHQITKNPKLVSGLPECLPHRLFILSDSQVLWEAWWRTESEIDETKIKLSGISPPPPLSKFASEIDGNNSPSLIGLWLIYRWRNGIRIFSHKVVAPKYLADNILCEFLSYFVT